MNMENIFFALQLMVVGMTTVFLILYLIIGLGKLLVTLTNAKAHEDTTAATTADKETIDATAQTIIQMAVAKITEGKGQVTHIKKL